VKDGFIGHGKRNLDLLNQGKSDRFGSLKIGSPKPRFHHHILQYLMDYHRVLGKTFMEFSLNLDSYGSTIRSAIRSRVIPAVVRPHRVQGDGPCESSTWTITRAGEPWCRTC
jgi:hypothetical protein